ncbi:phosphotransferase family protein [Paenibacillus agricola]|uniref:Aminoglycoside phosphotransferase family protein n=1 Tax=Paenibacillus agricola TaxID=2716264 RepID=A0ABX0J283_9BACL|nr:aminoglycoside phosphotransferase family protein [Paenibacillus agricola]NHN28992.1 aminoglycoside phosphotransferase family protein [Paenibacillus agricola]
MANENETVFSPTAEVGSAYAASFPGESRRVMSIDLVSSMPKMKKWILEYALTSRDETGVNMHESVIAKVFSDPEKGTASYHLMQYLWSNSMSEDPQYTLVRPISYIHSLNLLLMSKAPGRTVKDWLYETDRWVEVATQIAVWLIRLHRVPLMQSSQTKRTRADVDLSRFVTELSDTVPEKEEAFQTFAAQLLHYHHANPWTGTPAMLHGDFHIKNVFWDGSIVTAIDFDHHFIGDAAWDVAYHACQMQLSAYFNKGNFNYFQPAVKTFIEAYLSSVPDSERQSFLQRLDFYRSRSLFESLHYEVCVCKTGALHIVDPFLQECEQSLQGKGFV